MTWSGNWIGPGGVFSWQAAKAGKMAAIKSSASIRCIGRGFFLPPRKRKMASDRLRSHRQREVNMGDASTACSSVVFTVLGCKRRAAEFKRETVLRAERQYDRVVIGRRLQFEIESHAEPFAQRQPERPVYPAAKRRMDDKLHPAGVVEKSLEHDVVVARHHPELLQPGGQVSDDLLGGVGLQAAGFLQVERRPRRRCRSPSRSATPARRPDTSSESSAVRLGASPTQNGIVGRAPSASITRTSPAVTRRMRHECVPRRKTSPAIDSMAKSSLTVPTNVSSGLGYDPVVAHLGDGPAARQCGQAGAAARPEDAVDAVAVQVRHARAPPRRDAF